MVKEGDKGQTEQESLDTLRFKQVVTVRVQGGPKMAGDQVAIQKQSFISSQGNKNNSKRPLQAVVAGG